jgi:peptidoglycan/LPS O-acetylase OafA/YrhL
MSSTATSQKGIYFPGLNGIRALAALSVVLWHIDDYKWRFGFADGPTLPKILLSGSDAVTMFFVLSGFLITYLLLSEIHKTGTVNVRKFYVRRALRIWPVYYFVLILGLVGLPLLAQAFAYSGGFAPPAVSTVHTFLYLVMLPNVNALIDVSLLVLPGISQLWTIGIEEQFYLIWPALSKLFAKRMIVVILGVFVVKFALGLFLPHFMIDENYSLVLRTLLGYINNLPFENMAIGALGAYLLFHKHWLLKIIFHPVVEKLAFLFIVANILVLDSAQFSALAVYYCIPYILFIMNVSSNPRSTVKLENPLFNWLGKLSYGMYMYHLVVAYIVFLVFTKIDVAAWNSVIFNIVVYTLILGLTLLASELSYRYFEMPFLRWKNRFTVVKSSNTQASPVDALAVAMVDISTPKPVPAESLS